MGSTTSADTRRIRRYSSPRRPSRSVWNNAAPCSTCPSAAPHSAGRSPTDGPSGPRTSFSTAACTSGFSAIVMRPPPDLGWIDRRRRHRPRYRTNNSTLAGFAAMELLSSTACGSDARRDGLRCWKRVAAVKPFAAAGLHGKIAGVANGSMPIRPTLAPIRRRADCRRDIRLPCAQPAPIQPTSIDCCSSRFAW